ncbi:DsbA family protein ASCRUDRAFT_24003, partial [Ascoidea rubescens DSM 1968]
SSAAAATSRPHSVDIFIDFVCPFSAKLLINWYNDFIPLIEKTYPNQFQFILRPQVQPWHAIGSALTMETILAVNQIQPDQVWSVALYLMKNQRDYFDTAVINENKNQILSRLANAVQLSTNNLITADQVYNILFIRNKNDNEPVHQNLDTKITNNLKYFTRFSRQNGVHVTPTISVDGVINPSIESSTKVDDLLKIF